MGVFAWNNATGFNKHDIVSESGNALEYILVIQLIVDHPTPDFLQPMWGIREARSGVVCVHGTPTFTDECQRRVSNQRTATALKRNIGLRERSVFLACLQNQWSVLNPHSIRHPRSVFRSIMRFSGLGIAALSRNSVEWLSGFILPDKLNKILWRKN